MTERDLRIGFEEDNVLSESKIERARVQYETTLLDKALKDAVPTSRPRRDGGEPPACGGGVGISQCIFRARFSTAVRDVPEVLAAFQCQEPRRQQIGPQGRERETMNQFAVNFQDFTVQGVGDFPLDMLRFDECWPIGGDDVQYMASDVHSGLRRIHLRTSKTFGCTPKRWGSFLWKVVAIEGVPV